MPIEPARLPLAPATPALLAPPLVLEPFGSALLAELAFEVQPTPKIKGNASRKTRLRGLNGMLLFSAEPAATTVLDAFSTRASDSRRSSSADFDRPVRKISPPSEKIPVCN